MLTDIYTIAAASWPPPSSNFLFRSLFSSQIASQSNIVSHFSFTLSLSLSLSLRLVRYVLELLCCDIEWLMTTIVPFLLILKSGNNDDEEQTMIVYWTYYYYYYYVLRMLPPLCFQTDGEGTWWRQQRRRRRRRWWGRWWQTTTTSYTHSWRHNKTTGPFDTTRHPFLTHNTTPSASIYSHQNKWQQYVQQE